MADRFLSSIQQEGTQEEKQIAYWTQKAVGQRLDSRSAYHAQQVALQVLSGGISGPVSCVLANIGHQAIHKAEDFEDGRNMGKVFLQGVQDNAGTNTEKVVARTSIDAGSNRLSNESGFHAYSTGLKTIA